MKQITLFALISVFALSGFAQETVNELYSNGSKMFEGSIVFGTYQEGSHFYTPTQSVKSAADVMVNSGDKVALKDGKWTFFFENGKVAAESYFNKGAKTGVWTSYHANGKISSEENFDTGKAVYFFQNGQKFQEGTLTREGLKTGHWKGWHENGQLNYEGVYINGMGSDIKWYSSTGELLKK